MIYTSDEIENFIIKNQIMIDMYKKQARLETQQYEEKARKNVQSKLGKSCSEDSIKRNDIQSAIGTLNIKPETYYKNKLKELLKQLPEIIDEIIEVIIFSA